MFTSEAYTLQDNTTIYGQMITAGKLIVKSQHLCYMKVDTNYYWNQHPQHNVIIVPTRKIIHPWFEVNAVTDFHDTPKILCNRTQAKKVISRNPICLTDSDYNYIWEEIGCWEKIEFERDIEVYSDDKEN